MIQIKPFTADGFGGYHADDVSSTLRVKESYGGGQVMIAEPIGVDLYNQSTTGEVSKTLNAIKSDSDHVPCVIEPIIFTPDTYMKIDNGGGIAYSLLERDYKDAQCVVVEDAESNRNA